MKKKCKQRTSTQNVEHLLLTAWCNVQDLLPNRTTLKILDTCNSLDFSCDNDSWNQTIELISDIFTLIANKDDSNIHAYGKKTDCGAIHISFYSKNSFYSFTEKYDFHGDQNGEEG